jgi:hypothetical protein
MTNWGSAGTVADLSEDDGVRKTRATIRYQHRSRHQTCGN